MFKWSLNVTNEIAVEKTFEEIVQTEGRLDGLGCAAVDPDILPGLGLTRNYVVWSYLDDYRLYFKTIICIYC